MSGISNGPNSRPLNDTIAETGPGIPDDAVGPDQLSPAELEVQSDEQIEALRRKGWVKGAEDRSEAQPS